MYLMSLDRFKAELDKCVLICCRCHSEYHDGLIGEDELIALEAARHVV